MNEESKEFLAVLGAGVAAAAAYGLCLRYRVAGPTQYVVRTGLGIDDIVISKKAVQWPFQTYRLLDMQPTTFSVEVDAMSRQRIPFRMPSVWTIGPQNNLVALQRYSRLVIDKTPDELQETVEGIIQGEARILTANMDLDDLFNNRGEFKGRITTGINASLEDLGLTVYNANIKELADLDEHNQYFAEQRKRALQQVNQKARVDVAEANRDGVCGEKANQADARKRVAQYDKEALVVENSRALEVADSDKELAVARAQFQREQDVAATEARAAVELRNWQLQQEVEAARREYEALRLAATQLPAADVDAKAAIRRAEGEAAAVRLRAEAALYAQQQEAAGVQAMRQAEAAGLDQLMAASGGSADTLARYLLISQRQLPELAGKQADALQGLQPRVNVWTTGGGAGQLSDTLSDLFKTGMPLFDGIKAQTGYDFLAAVPRVAAKPVERDD